MPTWFRTEALHGYAVRWSPYRPTLLAVSTAQYYGIVGNGRLYILDCDQGSQMIQPVAMFESQDGQYDVAWSEMNDNQLVSTCGDGSIKLWDLQNPGFPLMSWEEHTQEVYAVDWNLITKDQFATGSWDDTIKLWSPESPTSIRTFAEHQNCIYSVCWSPYVPTMLASCAGDRTVKLWDMQQPMSTTTIPAHDFEVLSCDWNKYNPNLLVTASVDKTIKCWDIRNPSMELTILHGHTYAVRRVRCSPHSQGLIASCSYDMTMKMWDMESPNSLLQSFEHHTEFTVGCDFNMFNEGQVCTAAPPTHSCLTGCFCSSAMILGVFLLSRLHRARGTRQSTCGTRARCLCLPWGSSRTTTTCGSLPLRLAVSLEA